MPASATFRESRRSTRVPLKVVITIEGDAECRATNQFAIVFADEAAYGWPTSGARLVGNDASECTDEGEGSLFETFVEGHGVSTSPTRAVRLTYPAASAGVVVLLYEKEAGGLARIT